MDNFSFDVIADRGLEDWVMCCAAGQSAVGWSAEVGKQPPKMVLYWTDPKQPVERYSALPFKADHVFIASLIKGWLDSIDYSSEPDHDGDNAKGFRLYNEDWGHVDGRWEAFMAVTPIWAIYGK